MARQEIRIRGMGCEHCVAAVQDALKGIEGVDVEAVEIGSARVRIDEGRASSSAVEQAIREAGYEPESLEELGG